jgi:hypothetical protein
MTVYTHETDEIEAIKGWCHDFTLVLEKSIAQLRVIRKKTNKNDKCKSFTASPFLTVHVPKVSTGLGLAARLSC